MRCSRCDREKDPKKLEDAAGRRFAQCDECRAVARAFYNERVDRVESVRREREAARRRAKKELGVGDNFRAVPVEPLADQVAFVIAQIPERAP